MKFDFRPVFKAIFWVVLIIMLAVVLFAVGLMVGYGVLGGGEPMDIFKPEIWQHIMDYIRQ